jgi:CBS domain-containing protein
MSATTTTPTNHGYRTPSFEQATVADAMHPGVMSCHPDATLADVARIMAAHHVHCLTVMGITHKGSDESFVWGIISDRDLLEGGMSGDPTTTARALARHAIINVAPQTPLREAGGLMLAHGASHLVVADPETQVPIGILSTLDVAGVIAWGEA